jgi:hypothetical protein
VDIFQDFIYCSKNCERNDCGRNKVNIPQHNPSQIGAIKIIKIANMVDYPPDMFHKCREHTPVTGDAREGEKRETTFCTIIKY